MKRLFSEDNVTFEGRFTHLNGVTLQPKPAQRGGPPIWVAGRSEAAIKRAGRLGDGLPPLPLLTRPPSHQPRPGPHRGRESRARTRKASPLASYQFIALADTYEEARDIADADLSRRYNQPFKNVVDRYVVMGNVDDCRPPLTDFADAGAQHSSSSPIVKSFRRTSCRT